MILSILKPQRAILTLNHLKTLLYGYPKRVMLGKTSSFCLPRKGHKYSPMAKHQLIAKRFIAGQLEWYKETTRKTPKRIFLRNFSSTPHIQKTGEINVKEA